MRSITILCKASYNNFAALIPSGPRPMEGQLIGRKGVCSGSGSVSGTASTNTHPQTRLRYLPRYCVDGTLHSVCTMVPPDRSSKLLLRFRTHRPLFRRALPSPPAPGHRGTTALDASLTDLTDSTPTRALRSLTGQAKRHTVLLEACCMWYWTPLGALSGWAAAHAMQPITGPRDRTVVGYVRHCGM